MTSNCDFSKFSLAGQRLVVVITTDGPSQKQRKPKINLPKHNLTSQESCHHLPQPRLAFSTTFLAILTTHTIDQQRLDPSGQSDNRPASAPSL